jgi:riboflavin synthase
MFTGIIQSLGNLLGTSTYKDGSIRLYLHVQNTFLSDVSIGDSIAIQGACMTVCEKFTSPEDFDQLIKDVIPKLTQIHPETLALLQNIKNSSDTISNMPHAFCSFDVSKESLSKIVDFQSISQYNLEKALRLNDFIGGHLVSGHVDGRARLEGKKLTAEGCWLSVAIPHEFSIFMMQKGSVTLNGVSLTINQIHEKPAPEATLIELYLIPHTLEQTTLKHLEVGQYINLEIDLMTRYVEKLLQKMQKA